MNISDFEWFLSIFFLVVTLIAFFKLIKGSKEQQDRIDKVDERITELFVKIVSREQ